MTEVREGEMNRSTRMAGSKKIRLRWIVKRRKKKEFSRLIQHIGEREREKVMKALWLV